MAAPTNLNSRIDHNLGLLAAELADFPEITEAWNSLGDANRVSYSIEWWDLMVRLRDLHEAHQSDQLATAQAQKYREMTQLLRKYLPIIRRLGLAEPPVPLDEAA